MSIVKEDNESVRCVGIENTLLYKNRFVGAGKFTSEIDADSQPSIGPHQSAAFYRTEALRQIDCLAEFGPNSLGLELALTLEAIGYETKINTSSKISAPAGFVFPEISGQESQSAIWRFAGSLAFAQGFVLACVGVAYDLVTSPFSSRSRTSLAERLSNFVCWQAATDFREFSEHAAGPQPDRIAFQDARKELPLSSFEFSTDKKAA